MTSIVDRSMFPVQAGVSSIQTLQARLATLQTQLGTGDKASDLAGMGDSRSLSLTLRNRLSAIEGYQQSIDTVNVRLDVLDQVMGQLSQLQSDSRTAATPAQSIARVVAVERFMESDLLNPQGSATAFNRLRKTLALSLERIGFRASISNAICPHVVPRACCGSYDTPISQAAHRKLARTPSFG